MKPLTDEDIEAAARKYCELVGLDPDAKILQPPAYSPDGTSSLVAMYGPQWKAYAGAVRSYRAMNQAIKEFL
jgi:hypothetical protein